jgi:hypothetical protein
VDTSLRAALMDPDRQIAVMIWLLIFAAFIAMMWWVGPERGIPPRTGASCVEVGERVRKKVREGRYITDDERDDLRDCSER